jgi:NAD(P)-dependent dehydrogenase (short-subunit alcohol dehydrogenase family)
MPTSHRPQVILITGASSGMGKEAARLLLSQGHVVYAAARRIELMQDLQAFGAHPLKMDVTDEAQMQAGIARITAAHGGVDVLVNNAGFGIYGAMEDTSMVDARYQFDVNFFGLARMTQLVLPYMRSQKAGKIINISSMGGKMYTPLGSWYHATKHALEGWSDCLRLELAPFGIQVVIVEPGIIATEFGDVASGPLLERSGKGPYARLAHTMAKATRDAYSKPNASSPPSLIADVIAEAVAARRAKTRYVAGKMAKPLIFIRKWFGDRFFDMAVMSQVK